MSVQVSRRSTVTGNVSHHARETTDILEMDDGTPHRLRGVASSVLELHKCP